MQYVYKNADCKRGSIKKRYEFVKLGHGIAECSSCSPTPSRKIFLYASLHSHFCFSLMGQTYSRNKVLVKLITTFRSVSTLTGNECETGCYVKFILCENKIH